MILGLIRILLVLLVRLLIVFLCLLLLFVLIVLHGKFLLKNMEYYEGIPYDRIIYQALSFYSSISSLYLYFTEFIIKPMKKQMEKTKIRSTVIEIIEE